MSFGAMTAWQAMLLLAGAAAAAAWLFLMKVRPPRVQVPSLLLWQRVLDRPREMTWWERVRRAVSLAATILIAAALALAVTRPEPRHGQASAGRTLIVLDSSWSMAARTSSGETRWQRAVRQARTLASSAGGDVALATTADGLVEEPTPDTALIETALDRIAPSGGDTVGFPHVPGAEHVHFLTDGAVARALDKDVTLHSVFDRAGNAAIIAFGARPSPVGEGGGEAYVQVANYADTAQQVHLTVTRGATVISDQRVDMAAGEAISQVVPLDETGSARLMARIEASNDALAEDNEAVAWLESRDDVNVTLVSDDPASLQKLFGQDSTLHLTVVKPGAYMPVTSGIVVFDRWVPADPPARPALCIAPPTATKWLGQPGDLERSAKWSTVAAHPVAAGVDPLTVEVKRVRALTVPGAVVLAISDKGTPLLSVVDRPDRRLVIWSFAPADSNLANAPGFPILAGDSIDWLARPSYGVLRPGPVRLPSSTVRVLSPDGKPIPVTHAGDSAAIRLSAPGLYLVDAGGSRGVVGMNVGDPEVSNLQRTSLAANAAVVAAGRAGWPWWLWAVVIAFVLISAEWWTWQRRVTV